MFNVKITLLVMNYKAFYRTYRPSTFEQVVGQEHVVKTLENILKTKKISHGYLFSGPRGTGKTSVARIFANALNCIHSESPEQICKICLNNSSKSLDVIEIDAASNNSVDDIRIIREQVNFSPTNHPYKIYIIDEVHMLSKSAFNSLLMTLEEPPKHVIFILATTNPDKIPDTILSRVQRYNFKRISKNYLREQLKFIFEQEKIICDDYSLEMIISLSNGSLRDALSIADQVNAFSNSNITKENIMEIFGLISIDSQIDLINFIVNKDVGNALAYFEELLNKGVDVSKLIVSLINLLKDFIIFKKTNNSSLLEVTDESTISRLSIKSDCVYKFLDVLTPLSNEVKYSEIPHQLFQLTIIKLCSIEENLKDFVVEKKISSIDKTQPLTVNENRLERTFDDLGSTKDIEDNLFIQKEMKKVNDNEIVNFENSQTILSDFNTQEVKKRFEQIEDKTIDLFDKSSNKSQLNTDELIKNTTTILNVSNEEIGIGNEVNESIIDSTQDLVFENDNSPKQIYDTNEINLLSEKNENVKNSTKLNNEKEFDTKSNLNEESTKEFSFNVENSMNLTQVVDNNETNSNLLDYQLTQPNIINLFLCSEKETFEYFKDKLQKAANNLNDEYSVYTILLKEVRFICSGQNFILVSSNENWVIEDLNDFKKEQKFEKFFEEYFGNDVHFFAITRKDYEDSKKLYDELKKTNSIPKKQPLPLKKNLDNEQPILNENDINDEHYKIDSKAKALFGSLFKKK